MWRLALLVALGVPPYPDVPHSPNVPWQYLYGLNLIENSPDGGTCMVYADGGVVISNCPITVAPGGTGGSSFQYLQVGELDAGAAQIGTLQVTTETVGFLDAGTISVAGNPVVGETGAAEVLLSVSGLGNVSGLYQTFFYPSTCAAPWPSPPCVCGAGAYGFGTCPPDGGTALGFSGVGPQDYCTASVSTVVSDAGVGYQSIFQATASPGDHDAGFSAGGVALSLVNWTTQTFPVGNVNLLAEVKCYPPK